MEFDKTTLRLLTVLFINFFLVKTLATPVSNVTRNVTCLEGDKANVVSKLDGGLSVNVEIIDRNNKLLTGLRYVKNNSSSALYHKTATHVDLIYLISSSKVATIDGSKCLVEGKNATKLSPLVIYPSFDGTNSPVFTLEDLFTKLSTLKFTESLQSDNMVTYSTCVNRANTTWITYNLTVDSGLNYSDPFGKEKPNEINITVYNLTNAKEPNVQYSYILRLSHYVNFVEETMLLPPLGVNCGSFGEDQSKKLPNFPDRFSIKSEYIDYGQNFIDQTEIFLDKNMTGYDYNRILEHQNLAKVAPLPNLPNGDYKVVHDFVTGLQYVVNMGNDSCVNISGIPEKSEDAKLINNETTIELKTPYSILIGQENLTFSYVGQRFFNGLPADVHIAESVDKNFTYEIWIYNKTSSNLPENPVIVLRTYAQGTSTPILKSQQTLSDLKPLTKSRFWQYFNVRPCLQMAENESYLLIALTIIGDLAKLNDGELIYQLREKLAQFSRISELRITDFYLQPVNGTNIFAFFQMADRALINGTKTKNFQPEIYLKDAYEYLNQSLNAQDLEFNIQGVKIRATKDALNFVPPYFAAFNSSVNVVEGKKGYSGGSMAALAFFMLLVGSAAGFGFAYFLWKRQRGIQYQIYE